MELKQNLYIFRFIPESVRKDDVEMSSYESLLSGRAVLAPYTGPSPAQLAEGVARLVSQSVDWAGLLAEADRWRHDSLVTQCQTSRTCLLAGRRRRTRPGWWGT